MALPCGAVLIAFAATALAIGAARRPPALRLTAAHTTRTVVPGAAARYSLRVRRRRGRAARVRMKVRGTPPGATVSWWRHGRRVRPLRMRRRRFRIHLVVQTTPETSTGSYGLNVVARNRRHRALRPLKLELAQPPTVEIGVTGSLAIPLAPGRSVPLDVAFTNPKPFPVTLGALTVGVDDRTSRPGCRGSVHFAVRGVQGLPVQLPPGQSRLSELLASGADWPQVQMFDLPTNQDACKNTQLTLRYAVEARR